MTGTAEIISYALALGVAAAIPGPGMTALVVRSVSGGAIVGLSLLTGLIMGDLIYLSFATFGLAVIAQSYGSLFNLINWAAACYLSLLAWQFWRHKAQFLDTKVRASGREYFSAWFAGLTITLGNPKTMAFYLAILPLVISLDDITMKVWGGLLVPFTVLILLVVGGIFIAGALRLRHFLNQPAAQRILFRTASILMLLAAVGMVLKTL